MANYKRWTSKEIQKVKDMVADQSYSWEEIAQEVGRDASLVSKTYSKLRRDDPTLPKKGHLKAVYVVFQGQEPIAKGTAEECAKQLGVKTDSIIYYASGGPHNRCKGSNYRYAERIDNHKEEDRI
jgi:hypothetical protein